MASDSKVMGTVESSSSICFIWHIAMSNLTYGYGDINCWGNSGAAATGVQYNSKVLMDSDHYKKG